MAVDDDVDRLKTMRTIIVRLQVRLVSVVTLIQAPPPDPMKLKGLMVTYE